MAQVRKCNIDVCSVCALNVYVYTWAHNTKAFVLGKPFCPCVIKQ